MKLKSKIKQIKFSFILLLLFSQTCTSLICQSWSIWTPEEELALPEEIEDLAKNINFFRLKNPLFDTRFIRNTRAVKEYLMSTHGENGQEIICITEDNEKIHCTYFDRNSNILLIAGPGFTNAREVMAPFIKMFDCDIVIFDYRGHGYKKRQLLHPSTWKLKPSYFIAGVNGSKVKMGEIEEKDVIAVIDTFKKIKNYKQVFGLGICYSALIFIKAQAIRPDLFDKLILDGCWFSLARRVRKIQNDLKLISDPQHGGCHGKWPLGKPCTSRFLLWLGEFLTRIKFSKLRIDISDYLQYVDIPLLFFHSTIDNFVPFEEFKEIWECASTSKKIALITNNHHVRNHFKQKELYMLLCNLFLELPHELFVPIIQNVQSIAEHELSKQQTKFLPFLEK